LGLIRRNRPNGLAKALGSIARYDGGRAQPATAGSSVAASHSHWGWTTRKRFALHRNDRSRPHPLARISSDTRLFGGGGALRLLESFSSGWRTLFPFAIGPDARLLDRYTGGGATGDGKPWLARLLPAIACLQPEPKKGRSSISFAGCAGSARRDAIAPPAQYARPWLSFGPRLMIGRPSRRRPS